MNTIRFSILLTIFALFAGCNVVSNPSNYVDDDQLNDTETYVDAGDSLEVTDEPEPIADGTIRGPLIYPSQFIPENMVICAENLETQVEYCNDDHIQDEDFINGVGFELEVPVGDYYVYAFLPENPDQKAYYNEFVECGLRAECTSREKIVVNVGPGEVVEEIMPHDWYSSQSDN